MNLVLNLPAELESELSAGAARLQLPVSEYALRLLAAGIAAESKPSNGAELVAYWQNAGLIGTRADIDDASAHARILRKQAENRQQP